MEIRGETRHRRALACGEREFEERISRATGRVRLSRSADGSETKQSRTRQLQPPRDSNTIHPLGTGKKRRKKNLHYRKDIGIRLRDEPNDARGKKLDSEDVFFGGKGSQHAGKNRGQFRDAGKNSICAPTFSSIAEITKRNYKYL